MLTTRPQAGYDPRQVGDYVPGTPGQHPVRGFTEGKIEDVAGAEGAFTIPASSMPANLDAETASLLWRGKTWRVMKIRERYFRGKLNGYTFYLAT